MKKKISSKKENNNFYVLVNNLFSKIEDSLDLHDQIDFDYEIQDYVITITFENKSLIIINKHNLTYRKGQIMAWKFDNNIPIYIQISNTLKLQIVTNQLKSGDKLPTVRDLAETAGVNPNTVQRALSDLETEGFVYSVRTTGRYVTDNEELIRRTRLQLAQNEVDNFVKNMLDLGFKQDELVKQLDDFLKGVSYE